VPENINIFLKGIDKVFFICYTCKANRFTAHLQAEEGSIMFEKNMHFAYLLDLYGEVLDEHARDIMKAYYEDDLSLSEIAEGENISRQGVRHIIKKSEEELTFLDERLRFRQFYEKLEGLSERLDGQISFIENEGISQDGIDKLRQISSEMLKRD